MQIIVVSIFPDIFESFIQTSLLQKSQEKELISFSFYNPRDFCKDKHQQIDDTVYGGGAGMLIKAEPIIDTVEHIIHSHQLKNADFSLLFPAPSKEVFNQKIAHGLSKKDALIFICGRYEGIDARAEAYFQKQYPKAFRKLSLGEFVLLGGEVASMTMIEAITRLIPGVIKEKASRIEESYAIKDNMGVLEAPQYTKPEEVKGMKVPQELLSGDQHRIKKWKEAHQEQL